MSDDVIKNQIDHFMKKIGSAKPKKPGEALVSAEEPEKEPAVVAENPPPAYSFKTSGIKGFINKDVAEHVHPLPGVSSLSEILSVAKIAESANLVFPEFAAVFPEDPYQMIALCLMNTTWMLSMLAVKEGGHTITLQKACMDIITALEMADDPLSKELSEKTEGYQYQKEKEPIPQPTETHPDIEFAEEIELAGYNLSSKDALAIGKSFTVAPIGGGMTGGIKKVFLSEPLLITTTGGWKNAGPYFIPVPKDCSITIEKIIVTLILPNIPVYPYKLDIQMYYGDKVLTSDSGFTIGFTPAIITTIPFPVGNGSIDKGGSLKLFVSTSESRTFILELEMTAENPLTWPLPPPPETVQPTEMKMTDHEVSPPANDSVSSMKLKAFLKANDFQYYGIEGVKHEYKLAKGVLMHFGQSWKGNPDANLCYWAQKNPDEAATVLVKCGSITYSLYKVLATLAVMTMKEIVKGGNI
jgi:hypothetical protein